jgi:hypothetical protein
MPGSRRPDQIFPKTDPSELTELRLHSIITLAEAVRLSGLSDDSWRRHHADKFIRLSPRRFGVRLRDALMLSAPQS